MSPVTNRTVEKVPKSFKPKPQPPTGGVGTLPITDIVARVSAFGRPMSKDRQPRPKDPVEARRVEDVRADLSVLQDALEVLNNFGAPGSPSFVFKRDDATAGTGDYAGTEYIEIEHNLGFTPDRWMIVDANAPGHGDIYALRDSTFVWSDTVAYLAWPDSSPFAGPSAEARVVFFRGGA